MALLTRPASDGAEGVPGREEAGAEVCTSPRLRKGLPQTGTWGWGEGLTTDSPIRFFHLARTPCLGPGQRGLSSQAGDWDR